MQIEIKTNLEPHIVSTRKNEIKQIAIYDEGIVVGSLLLRYDGNVKVESHVHGYELRIGMKDGIPIIYFERNNNAIRKS